MRTTVIRNAVILSVLGAISTGSLFVHSLGVPASPALGAEDFRAYKPLYESRCSACHNLPDPSAEQNTKERWRAIVTSMSARAAAAGTPISDDDQAHIVDYLGLFPPKPAAGANDPLATRHEDVWAKAPERSLVYTFYAPDQLADFQKWNASGTAAADAEGVEIVSRPDFGLMVHKGETLDGGLDLRAQVRLPDGKGSERAAGLLFGYTAPGNYFAALLDLVRGEARIVRVQNNTATVIASGSMGDIDMHSDWHTLRVMYRPELSSLSMWVDSSKRLTTSLTGYADGGQFGLAAAGSTRASFRNLYADIYGKQAAAS